MGYSSSHKGYKCLSSFGRINISKDVLFNELRFPYSDMFPSSSNPIKNLDSYFSLNPNLSPPCVIPTPQSSQLSPFHSPSIPLVPFGFSPIPTHSPTTSFSVPCPSSTSSEPTSVHPQTSKSSTPSASSSESVSAPNSIPDNTHFMQIRFKSGIHNPRLHPFLFLTHSEPKTVKQALKNPDWLAAMQQEYGALLKNKTWDPYLPMDKLLGVSGFSK